MSTPVYSLEVKPTVSSIYTGLQNYDFHGFPIVNSSKKVVGLISRHYLITLITKQMWKDPSSSMSARNTPEKPIGKGKTPVLNATSMSEN